MTTRTIEVCDNAEWLANFGPLADLGHGSRYESDAADEWHAEVCRRLEIEIGGVDTVTPRGERTLLHGWNGANTFERKGCGLGTFDQFDAAEWDRAVAISDAVAAEVAVKYVAKEIAENVADLETAIASAHWRRVKPNTEVSG
jgi:hypothetical protein